jgi:hypothetical protein
MSALGCVPASYDGRWWPLARSTNLEFRDGWCPPPEVATRVELEARSRPARFRLTGAGE